MGVPHRHFASIFLFAFLSLHGLSAKTESPLPVDPSTTEALETRQLNYLDALILGAVEGITEYLPISSTGHLILTNALLGLDSETPIPTADGSPYRGKNGEPFTLKMAVDAYAIVIQIGAILAVVLLYWKRLFRMGNGLLGRDPEGLRLVLNLLVAFMPAVVIGLLLNDWIERMLFSPIPIAIALTFGSILIWGAEWYRHRHGSAPDEGPDLHDLSYKQCLFIGLMQCVAMWPGTSRSMMTIVGSYLSGLNAKRSAEFSFLLGLITLSAAAGYKCLKNGSDMVAILAPGPVLFGTIVAFLFAIIAVKWLVAYLSKHGLGLFAWYRLIIAALVLIFMR